MKIVLHVGCGSCDIKSMPPLFQNGEWEELRYDIDESVNPDIIGTLQDISAIEDGSIDAVFSSHNIEHVWTHEVPCVLAEFSRILKPDGFALILCPDLMSVANAIVDGFIENTLYVSPAGPISSLDIIYGFGAAIKNGNHYMAHKTAFTSSSLANHLMRSGFSSAIVARDKVWGLHAVAFKNDQQAIHARDKANMMFPVSSSLLETREFGLLQ